jgi:Bifunctional DNA primase/polymerase, N-terminal/Protein of unknown function (DUF3987)
MKHNSEVPHYARKYTGWGWHVVPIDSHSKRPSLKNWQDLRLKKRELPKYFDETKNIGVLLGSPSRELMDVDLDCEEAINLARSFLPATKRIHGRKSKKTSHFWYHAKFLNGIEKFNDVDGKSCLLELRGSGHQTVVPPSIHPSGERLRWEIRGKARRISINKLLRAVRKLASATILARHWPELGCRNDAALALAGVLLRAGWSVEEGIHFISEVARASNDEEWKERGNVVAATNKKLNSGGPVTGIPKLNELIGANVVTKVLEWLGIRETPASLHHEPTRQNGKWPKALKEDAYCGLVGDFVRTIEPHTESDPAALLVQFLTAFGNSVGAGPHFQIEGKAHRSNLFCLIVGRSSKARKGTALAHVMKVLKRVDARWAQRCLASNLSSGEGIIWAVRDIDQNKNGNNKKRKADFDHATSEKRLLVVQSEFASALRIQRREGNILSPIVRQAWDGDKLRILTKNSPVQTTGEHISIIGHITQDELRRELRDTDGANGYANRFLFVCVERSKYLPLGGHVKRRDLEPLTRKLTNAHFHARKATQMCFTPKAEELWGRNYERLTAEVPGMLGAITARAEAQVLRLSIVYALLDCKTEITTRHLRAALAVWKYCAHSARYIFGGALGDKKADRILQALRKNRHGMTRTQIRELFKHNVAAEIIERALTFLSQQNLATFSKEETDGRPVERWSAL